MYTSSNISRYTEKKTNTIPNSMICIFMAGFCLGMVFFYLSDKAYAKESGLMDTTHIRQLQEFRANINGVITICGCKKNLAILSGGIMCM